jgi:PBSX family phage terminase large subunit
VPARTIDLYGRQFDFVTSAARLACLGGGIGSGKSIAGAVRALYAGLGRIGGQPIPTPNLGVVTAPTYPMLRDATLRTFLDIARDAIREQHQSENRLTLVNGSEILFRSADVPDRLRGPNLTWWWGDEAAYYEASVWRIMIGRLRQGGRQGWAWLTTTPKGRNWLYQEFVAQDRADYRLYGVRTRDNPFLDEGFIASLEGSYAGDFARQELAGEFVSFEGLIYPEFRREAHVTTAPPDAYAHHVAGVDWGYANPGVILVFGVDGDGRMVLRREEYQRQRRIEEWATLARQLRDTYAVECFYCDPSEPTFIGAFEAAGCPCRPATNDVLPGIQAVKNRLVRQGDGRTRLVLTSEAVQTVAEFESYQWLEHRDGVLDKPRKTSDHTMDALRYAVMGVDADYVTPAIGSVVYADAGYGAGAY